MKAFVRVFISVAFIGFSACSTQQVSKDNTVAPIPEKKPVTSQNNKELNNSQNPPMTITKDGKTLNLVRVMDGGVCKDSREGVKGTFLVYANAEDIARIKQAQGTKIFATFETKIQSLAETGLLDAVNQTNLAANPFSLGADEAKENMARDLNRNFRSAVANSLKKFEVDTGLAIDVDTYPPSLEFFQQGCQIQAEGN
jgi:hypothetical protein